MRLARLCLLALLLAGPVALARQASDPPDGEAPRPPAAAGVLAGMHGLLVSSEVRLLAAPDQPQELVVAFGFPDRARWLMKHLDADEGGSRRIEYRFGESAFVWEAGQRGSAPMEGVSRVPGGPERDAFLRRCAIRQAAFVWPEGALWSENDERRTAPIFRRSPPSANAGDPDAPDPATIGRLVAALGPDGRPSRLECFDAQGQLEETLEIQAWSETDGRSWPARLVLSYQGRVIWNEVVRSTRPQARHEDRFFVPADQHALLRPFARPMRKRLPETVRRTFALDPNLGWAEAQERAAELREAALRECGPEVGLAPGFALVLADDGSPAAVDLALQTATARPPEGWTPSRPREAIVLILGGHAPPTAQDLERLEAGIPAKRTVVRRAARFEPNEIHLVAELD